MTAQPKSSNAFWLAPVAFALSFIVLYFSAMPLLDDPDVPWHLATGKLLLATRALPDTDPWSFASLGAPWYLLSWVWNLFLGIIETIGGAFGVYLATIAISALLVSIQAQRLCDYAIDHQAIFLTLMMTGLCMVEFASARPHLVGYVLILVFCRILHHSRTSQHYGLLSALPLMMLLWVNSHGSFLAGFTLLGAYGIESIASKQYGWLKRLLLISAACAAAALANPYGIDIFTGAMQSIDSDLRGYIIEWQPFTINQSIGLSMWMVVFILASNIRNPNVPLADKIASFAWLLGTLLITRNGAIFLLVSAPYLASCLDMQTRDLRDKTHNTPVVTFLRRQSASRLWSSAIAVIILFSTTVAVLPHATRVQSETASIDDAIAYIRQYQPKRHYLSDFDFGGQLIYHTDGTIAFFMDSRSNTAYSHKEMQNYLAFVLQQPGWQEKIAAYGIDGIIAHNQSAFAKAYAEGHYRDRWHLVFAGKRASVYIAAPSNP